jgi:FkbM family methyltransferase
MESVSSQTLSLRLLALGVSLALAASASAAGPARAPPPACVVSAGARSFDLAELGGGGGAGGATALHHVSRAADSLGWTYSFAACGAVAPLPAACAGAAPGSAALQQTAGACFGLGAFATRTVAATATGVALSFSGGDGGRSSVVTVECADVARPQVVRWGYGAAPNSYAALVRARAGCALACSRDPATGTVCGGMWRGKCVFDDTDDRAHCACSEGHVGADCSEVLSVPQVSVVEGVSGFVIFCLGAVLFSCFVFFVGRRDRRRAEAPLTVCRREMSTLMRCSVTSLTTATTLPMPIGNEPLVAAAPTTIAAAAALGRILALCVFLFFALALASEGGVWIATSGGGESSDVCGGGGSLLRGMLQKAHAASASGFVDAFDAAATTLGASSAMASADTEACAHELPALQREFVLVLRSSLSHLSDVDSATLVPFLRRFYSGTPRPLLIDVGANVGDTSEALMELLCAPVGEQFIVRPETGMHRADSRGVEGAACGGTPQEALRGGRVLAYEPMAKNFIALKARGNERGWGSAGWRAFEMALVAPEQAPSEAAPAQVKFFSSGETGDQQGGLAANSSFVTEENFELVPAWTIDAHLDSLDESRAPVLLLKVDAEGFDAHVLRGAARLLRERRAHFVTFEYNSKWKSDPSGASLRGVIEDLRKVGYLCWLMTPTHLIPLSGRWWVPEYEIWAWSNVVCARSGQSDGALLVGWWNEQLIMPFGCE